MHKILVIEKDDELRTKVREILHSRLPSIHIIEAKDANATLAVLSDDTPDLILMDIQLHGISGLELIEEIKRQYPHITIIINSNYDSIEYRVATHQIGADYFFSKKDHSLNDIVFLITEVSSRNSISSDVVSERKYSLESINNFINNSQGMD